MERGDTFMIEDEDGANEHLHVVLTDPSLAGEVVTVNITTRRKKSESLVCVQPGEHPFIIEESIVPYHYAAIRTCEDIEKSVSNGTARRKEKASPELIQKMIAGLLDSDFTPHGVRAYYKGIAEGESL